MHKVCFLRRSDLDLSYTISADFYFNWQGPPKANNGTNIYVLPSLFVATLYAPWAGYSNLLQYLDPTHLFIKYVTVRRDLGHGQRGQETCPEFTLNHSFSHTAIISPPGNFSRIFFTEAIITVCVLKSIL